MNNQLLSLEGKAGAAFIWLIKVHAFVSCHDELEILGGVAERRTAQSTAVRVQLQVRIVLHRKRVRLQAKHKVLGIAPNETLSQRNLQVSLIFSQLTSHLDVLRGHHKEMRGFARLSEGKASNRVTAFV